MNILQIAPAYYPAISIGGPIFSTLTFSEIVTKDHQLTTLTTQLGLDKEQLKKVVYNKRIKVGERHDIIYKKYQGYPHFTFSFSHITWLLNNVKEYDLVVFQGVWNFPFIMASIACRIHNVPYILFPHGNLYEETINLKSGFIKKAMFRLFVRSLLEKAANVVFTTTDEQTKVTEHLQVQLNSVVVPNVVKQQDFSSLPEHGLFRSRYHIPSDTKLLLHLGRISKKKGIEFTLFALKELVKKGYNVKFVVAGGDEERYKKNVDRLVSELALDNSIIFTGLLSREETISAFVDCDIFVLPSYSENFGIAVVEAMLCNMPVVISGNVGIAKQIGDAGAGIVVDIKETHALDIALEQLLKDDKGRIELGRRGKEFAVSNYDTDIVENEIRNLLYSSAKIKK